WVDRDERGGPKAFFTSHNAKSASTVSTPGTSRHAITVGNYVITKTIDDSDDPHDDLAESSSVGPTRNGFPKPDIAAPGEVMASARSVETTNCCHKCCCDCCFQRYEAFHGTSAAAPHVTGAVALMLQQEPLLDNATIRRRLRRGADQPEGLAQGSLPNN